MSSSVDVKCGRCGKHIGTITKFNDTGEKTNDNSIKVSRTMINSSGHIIVDDQDSNMDPKGVCNSCIYTDSTLQRLVSNYETLKSSATMSEVFAIANLVMAAGNYVGLGILHSGVGKKLLRILTTLYSRHTHTFLLKLYTYGVLCVRRCRVYIPDSTCYIQWPELRL